VGQTTPKHKTLQQHKLLSATLCEKTWSPRWPVLLAQAVYSKHRKQLSATHTHNHASLV